MRRVLLGSLLALTAAFAAGALVVVLAGHLPSGGGGAAMPADETAGASAHHEGVVPPAVTTACTAGSVVRLDRADVTQAVIVRRTAVAYRKPGRAPVARFGHLNVNGVPTVFAVLGARVDESCRPQWYHVQLPMRPNGITGWVRARDVAHRKLDVRIVVDLSDRRVTLYRGKTKVLATTAAIGRSNTPTPTGRYYVNQKLLAPDPLGPFGPAAIGISAFSPVLQHWVQGGPIAIHGTNEPSLLGSAVSNGCIRISNDVIERLWELVPAGTPVLIRS
jgi:lipoprotein-anchoring transpeptidase ErfK/SrfK